MLASLKTKLDIRQQQLEQHQRKIADVTRLIEDNVRHRDQLVANASAVNGAIEELTELIAALEPPNDLAAATT